MIDFVISGSRGFIGGSVAQALKAAGYRVSDDKEFATIDERCRIFLNCTNIPNNPYKNIEITRDRLDLAKGRTDVFIQLLSFSTLIDGGKLDADGFNFGKRPTRIDQYSGGKLEQERLIFEVYETLAAKRTCLLYLPAVLGNGGSWSRVLEQARKNGVLLPAKISTAARANWVDVDDLVTFLIAQLDEPTDRQFERVILNREAAAGLTWEVFLSDGGAVEIKYDRLSDVKGFAVSATDFIKGKLLFLLYETRIFLWTFKLLGIFKSRRRPIWQPPSEEVASGPVRFRGVITHLVRTQPYLPGESSKKLVPR